MSSRLRFLSFILTIAVFFVAEWLWGTLFALLLSAIIPAANMIISLLKHRRVDSSSVFDLAIVVLFSIAECIPYKWSFSLLSLGALFLLMYFEVIDFKKVASFMPSVKNLDNPYLKYKSRHSQLRLALVMIIGSALYFVAEMGVNESYSNWTSKWLLLTLVLLFVAIELLCIRIDYMRYKDAEWVPLVDESGNVIGQCPRPLVHNGSLWLHPVVHLHVINDGKLLLQLRPQSKKIQPGKWDTAVGGHIDAGETLEVALKREVWEEIGLGQFNAKLMTRYVWECPVEHEYVFSFVTKSSGPFATKNIGEVDELRFWSSKELSDSIGKGVFTPNLEKELVDWILPNIGTMALV